MKMTNAMAKFLAKVTVFLLAMVATFFVLSSVLDSATIVVNWVKLLIAGVIIGISYMLWVEFDRIISKKEGKHNDK